MSDRAKTAFTVTRWVFVRWLAVIYLIAFVSLWSQIHGLIGGRGILPATEFLEAVHRQLGSRAYWLLPTLGWLGASDGMLHGLCATGAAAAALALFGLAEAPCLIVAWICYLSLSGLGQIFLSFQWDALLLETGFAALFLASWRLRFRPTDPGEPSRISLWVMRWLLFRLLFSSGMVKLASGDATWRQLTALRVHYETQPLPTAIGWYAHQLPVWFQTFSCAAMFAIEIGVPFLIFAPQRIRRWAAVPLIFLQILILLTGNYGFFNWLAIGLCLILLDDTCWPENLRKRFTGERSVSAAASRWRLGIQAPLALLLVALSVPTLWPFVLGGRPMPPPIEALEDALQPLRLVSRYGLFAVMTTERREIQIEGSNDGEEWKPYLFKYKPGPANRAPCFVAPHQPRLDWQMWFAALGDYRRNAWLILFCQRLMEGSPSVLRLLESNPFPDKPPVYVRAVVYRYRFTDGKTRKLSGAWWTQERLGLYLPKISLRDLIDQPK